LKPRRPGSSAERRAPGFRGYGEGALGSVSSNGYSWASTVSDINSMYLGFHVTWLNLSSTYYRAFGFQLRCLSE